MTLLIVGLLAFFAVHLLPTMPGRRTALVERLGANGYKALFSVLSLAGFTLIVIGKGDAAFVPVWTPPPWTRHATMALMLPALVMLVATYAPCRIRRALKHPMLIAVKTWALAHLLANGDLASMLLFGSFLAYAVYDRISIRRRDATAVPAVGAIWVDAAVVVGGLALYGVVARFHGTLFGVSIIPG